MSPPPQQNKQGLDFSDREAAQLEAYAQEHGLTPQQAATKLAQQILKERYRIKPKAAPKVLPFRRR